MSTHRYWRLYIFATSHAYNTYCAISEIELRSSVGGSDLTGSGVATARAKAISDAADTIAELGQANTFTSTNTFTGTVMVP